MKTSLRHIRPFIPDWVLSKYHIDMLIGQLKQCWLLYENNVNGFKADYFYKDIKLLEKELGSVLKQIYAREEKLKVELYD